MVWKLKTLLPTLRKQAEKGNKGAVKRLISILEDSPHPDWQEVYRLRDQLKRIRAEELKPVILENDNIIKKEEE